MLGAFIHRVLRTWMFRVPTDNLGMMPLFTLIDLPFVAAFSPGAWYANARCLRVFQEHLTTHQWASLSEIYPRNLMWIYVYLLFAWSRYCNCLSRILTEPDRCLPAEMFVRYICEIDRHVDSFDSRLLWKINPRQLKNLPQARTVASALCAGVSQAKIDTLSKRRLIQTILQYRHDALKAMQCNAEKAEDNVAEVISNKENTAGKLWYVWSRILGYLYEIPDCISEDAAQIFLNFGMALQIIDDLSDAPADYAVCAENLFVAVAQTYPADWSRLQQHLATQPAPFLEWRWARNNLPDTYKAALDIYQSYLTKIRIDAHQPKVTLYLCHMLDRLRALGG